MKYYFIVYLAVLLWSQNAISQTLSVGGAGKTLISTKASNYSGSPYYNDQFTSGTIKTNNNKNIEISKLRYNVINQGLEFMDKETIFDIQDSVKVFTLKDSLGHAHSFEKMGDNFFQVITGGKISLLKHYSAKKTSTEDWYTKRQTKSIVHEITYYYDKGGKQQKLNLSSKNILAVFDDKREEVKTYLETEQIDLKDENNLISLFQYYNNLK